MALYVKDWNDNFENSRTRSMAVMQWVPVPNRFDDDGYTELLDHENGAEHLAAWLAILKVASRCPERGKLVRDNSQEHDASTLSRISRIPAPVFESAIPRLLEIGWLESDQPLDEGDRRVIGGCQEGDRLLSGSYQAAGTDMTLFGPEPAKPVDTVVLTFPTNGPTKTWDLLQSRVDVYVERYPSLDVLQVLTHALQWIEDNPTKRKTAKGMPNFLTQWLNRQNDRQGSRQTYAQMRVENSSRAIEDFANG